MLAFKNFVHEDVTRKGEMVDEAKLAVLTPPANSELRKKLQAAVDATAASSDKKAYTSLAVLRASIGDPELLQDIVKYVEAAAKEAQLLEADKSFTFAGRAELRFIDAEMHPQSSTQWSPKFIASADGCSNLVDGIGQDPATVEHHRFCTGVFSNGENLAILSQRLTSLGGYDALGKACK